MRNTRDKFSEMHWTDRYQLFLFDFDGLLVNTEALHFQAYLDVFADHGIHLKWSLEKYCTIAHYGCSYFCQVLCEEYPTARPVIEKWDLFYAEKRERLHDLTQKNTIPLMPGVDALLRELSEKECQRCVVTHSPQQFIEQVCRQHPILQTIPHWVTREQYTHPKPHPECYLTAIRNLTVNQGKFIGFEDSPRGLIALKKVVDQAIFVTRIAYPDLKELTEGNVLHYPSLETWRKELPSLLSEKCVPYS